MTVRVRSLLGALSALALAASAVAQDASPRADGGARLSPERAALKRRLLSGAPQAIDAGVSLRSADAAAKAPSARDAAQAQGASDAAVAARAGAPDLAAVLAELAKIDALSARFREEKRMALLAQPLVSEGAIHYEKPRRLARHTERPRPGSMVLDGDVLTFGDKQRSESIGLSSQPALRLLVETFVSVLAGDRAALERAAEVSIEPSGAGFRIRVVPRDAAVKRIVQFMAFEGAGALLSRMELVDATGDRTLTAFSGVTLRKRFNENEFKRLFRVGG